MPIELTVRVLDEPELEFASDRLQQEPKVGLMESGPYSLRYGNDFPSSVRVGFVGQPEMVDNGRKWFERCQRGLLSGKANRRRHPDFPPFKEVFRSPLEMSDRWTVEIGQRRLGSALSRPGHLQFEGLLDLYSEGVSTLADRGFGPNVIVCSLTDQLLERFSTTGEVQRKRRARTGLGTANSLQQLSLFASAGLADSDEPDSLLSRNFRRSLKANAMDFGVPIQLAHNRLFNDREDGDDPATKAWDSCGAIFYKAGGIPWRLSGIAPHVCFVGISFHHLRTEESHVVFSSCAQAFSTDTEGFVLRGDRIDWDEALGRNPHLNYDQALRMGKAILAEYRSRTGRDPLRLVVHKRSKFNQDEKDGFAAAWERVPTYEFITMYPSDFRLLPQGDYPPRRGTIVNVGGTHHLYTAGFFEPWGSYPGPHIPRPIEVRFESENEDEGRAGHEILGLTKMNFNSASPFEWAPITTRMAKEVGLIMAEVGEEKSPEMSYRYYM